MKPKFLQILGTVPCILGFFLTAYAQSPSGASPGNPSASPLPEQKKIVPYRIITNDRLGVHIFQEDDLGLTVRVDGKGDVNLNMVGEVHLAGMTLQEAQQAIEKAYFDGGYLRHPKVTLTPEELAPRLVSVQGYVKNPAQYSLPIETATSLLDIIVKASGFLDTAAGTRVKVTRINSDGSLKVFEVDVEDVMKGKTKDKEKIQAANMELQAGDVIYVPERII
jgi:polysaccharide export outer membrane protein